MNKVMVLLRKEIMDILRDKKTLVVMVLVPILLYPLILVGMAMIFSHIAASQVNEIHTVACSAKYEDFLDELQTLYEEQEEMANITLNFQIAEEEQKEGLYEEPDVWLDISENDKGNLHIAMEYTSTNQGADYTEQAMEELLELYREKLLKENLKQEGLDESFLEPITYEAKDDASLSESMGMDIGGSIGMMLIVTIMLGAVYPAIDATAGEKERGTLETLLTLPVTNFQMILSKYISVAIFASVTAVLSVLSLGGSVLFLMYGLSEEISDSMGSISFSGILSAIPVLLLTVIVTALLIAAVCMCFCVFAKSFKEANNYVTPVMLIVMFASMAAMVPSIKLDYRTAMIPLVNVSLMVKQVVSQQFDVALAGVTMAVNLGYSILIIWILAKMYDSENILFSDGFRSFRIFQKRSDITKGTLPAPGDLVISVTVLFLLMIYVGSAVSVRMGFAGTAVSQILILAVPLAVVWYMKSDIRTLFSMRCPAKGTIIGSMLLYIGTYCIMFGISMILANWLPESAQNLEEAFNPIVEQGLPAILLVTAVMPAIGEEIFFRGFLLGSLRGHFEKRTTGKKGIVWAIMISAVIFGAFHMSLVKLLPTALLGAAFAYIVWKGGSIYVTMFLHFLNNAVSMWMMKYPEMATRYVPLLMKERMSVMEVLIMLAGGVVCAGMGMFLLRRKRP